MKKKRIKLELYLLNILVDKALIYIYGKNLILKVESGEGARGR